MEYKIEKLPAFPPGSNPYRHDAWRQGEMLGNSKTLHLMYHSDTDREFVIVDTKTGERLQFSRVVDTATRVDEITPGHAPRCGCCDCWRPEPSEAEKL